MKLTLLCIFYFISLFSYSQHDQFFSDMAAAKNTDEKIRRFVSYLDEIETGNKNSNGLSSFFVKLEKTEPSIKNYIAFQKQLLQVQQKTDWQTRIAMYHELAEQSRDEKHKVFVICRLHISS